VVSAYDYESYILAALQAGAAGYLLKDAHLDELVSAIRLVYKGGNVLDLRATNKLIRRFKTINKDDIDTRFLRSRETEVLCFTARGLSNKEIADQMGISERTVQAHLFNIFRKLGANSRTQAVLFALKEGYITIENL
jgi:DNA-binding NarL/FixJ family response regulator